MTILALDPGITTGVAIHLTAPIVNLEPAFPGALLYEQIPTGEVFDNGYATLVCHKFTEILELIKYHQPTVVIFEDFNSGGLIDKNGQATIRLIGSIETMTYMLNIPTCLQFPRERYPFVAPARSMIRAMNKKYLVHEIDALSHLLLYEDRVHRGVLDKIIERRRTNKVSRA